MQPRSSTATAFSARSRLNHGPKPPAHAVARHGLRIATSDQTTDAVTRHLVVAEIIISSIAIVAIDIVYRSSAFCVRWPGLTRL